jgi:hypothetical protein
MTRNTSQAHTMEDLGNALGFERVASPMGPFPLEDTFDMKITCITIGPREVGGDHPVRYSQEDLQCLLEFVSCVIPRRVSVGHGL